MVSTFSSKTLGVLAKKLSLRVGKDAHRGTENTNFYSQGAYRFPGLKQLLTLESVPELCQLALSRRVQAVIILTFIPNFLGVLNLTV